MEVDQDSEAPSCSFYVVRVPEAVFSTDPDVSLKVSMKKEILWRWLRNSTGTSAYACDVKGPFSPISAQLSCEDALS